MGADSETGSDGHGRVVDDDDDPTLEPEILRWLGIYAGATDGRGDATVAAILDEMNELLRRHRSGDAAHPPDDPSRLRALTERVRAEQERAAQRERQAHLEGLLLAARQLTTRVTSSLAASAGAIDRLVPDPGASPHLRDAIADAAAGLAEAARLLAELERVIDPGAPERSGRGASEGDQAAPSA